MSDSSLVNMCGIALSLSGVHIKGHLGVTADGEIPAEQEEVPMLKCSSPQSFSMWFHICYIMDASREC